MKKGFTLMEVLAVIVIISIITLLAIPNIINNVNNKRSEMSDITIKMIEDATDMYVKENLSNFPIEGAPYCIKIEDLVNDGKLVEPVKDLKSDKEIPLNYGVEITIVNNQYSYEILNHKCQ